MRWLADECVDAGLVARLRGAGHDVLYMAEVAPAQSDTEVLARAHGRAGEGGEIAKRVRPADAA